MGEKHTRRLSLLVCAATASLLTAVPASASHHPPNAASGLVSMTVSREANNDLVFNYTVTQQQCPNPSCDVNYGKPYGILFYADAPDGTNGVLRSPVAVSVPAKCTLAGLPLVRCDPGARSQTDPAAALPMTASIRLHVSTRKGSTAEIVAAGYSLNTYQEGVPIPPANCAAEQRALDKARATFEARVGDFLEDLVRLSATDGFRRSALHDLAKAKTEKTADDVRHLLSEAAERKHELNKCEGVEKKASSARARARAACTEDEWGDALTRADRLKLIKAAPFVKKITAAQKANQRTKAARLRKQLNSRLATERKSVVALRKALKACL